MPWGAVEAEHGVVRKEDGVDLSVQMMIDCSSDPFPGYFRSLIDDCSIVFQISLQLIVQLLNLLKDWPVFLKLFPCFLVALPPACGQVQVVRA